MTETTTTVYVERSRLEGTVRVSGAKNSALRLLAASLLTSGPVKITNYPAALLDAQVHEGMLRALGKTIIHDNESAILITEDQSLSSQLVWDGRSIRNTLLVLGALVARTGSGSVPLPGGCDLGERKFDLHLDVLQGLGAEVWEESGYLCAHAPDGLIGADIHLRLRSTGATENAILAGTLARGITRVWNPHVRPEILDLIAMLRSMGSLIEVHGQEHIAIHGAESLGSVEHRVIPDNMEAITWLIASVMTDGDCEIVDFPTADLTVVLAHLEAAGARLFHGKDSLLVRGGRCWPIEIATGPHPAINSDVQPLLAAWATAAVGESRIIDLRFPGRYGYAKELSKMGAQVSTEGDILVIKGRGGQLHGDRVRALDLRAGAALTLAGLTAAGTTTIEDFWQVERGYENFATKLRSLGGCLGYG